MPNGLVYQVPCPVCGARAAELCQIVVATAVLFESGVVVETGLASRHSPRSFPHAERIAEAKKRFGVGRVT